METAHQVWSADSGYPGDGRYREFYRDLGYDLDYDYIRPYLHSDGVRRNIGIKYCKITGKVPLSDKQPYNPQLAEKARVRKPETDFGFSSGHTFRGYMAALGYSYVFPERYQAFLKVASDIGFSRNRAGMHNCLDVMGGRMVGTATAAAIFCDPKNRQLLLEARTEGDMFLRSLENQYKTVVTDADKRAYEERLTYGFAPVGSVD